MSATPLIELHVPVEPASVSIVRTSVASLAARHDFTLDRLEDLRLATNEACALLIALTGTAGATLTAVVESPASGSLRVDLRRDGSSANLPSSDDFAWTVLEALVDQVTVTDEAGSVHVILTASGGLDSSGSQTT